MSYEKRTISLSAEQGAFIDALVASGDYATASEVVRDGLRALQERKTAIERWLREEVAPTYDRMQADPARALSSETMAERARRRDAARTRSDG